MNFPKHEGGLFLTHNEHKNYYKTVQQSIEEGDFGYTDDSWISVEQLQKAIDTNECWTLQWYPDTPVGFCLCSAAELEPLLAHANAV